MTQTQQPATVEQATARVQDFLRQWSLMRDKTDLIYGVNSDPDAEMADLFASDLHVILAAQRGSSVIGRKVTTADLDDEHVPVGTIIDVNPDDNDFVLVQWPGVEQESWESWVWLDELRPIRRSNKAGA